MVSKSKVIITNEFIFYHFRTNLERVPSFGGQTLDLYALYNTVTSFGGISVVCQSII